VVTAFTGDTNNSNELPDILASYVVIGKLLGPKT
jgi:hypothetical protein